MGFLMSENHQSKAFEDELVSVIIPTYNRVHCIERAMRSVLAQTYRNLELIIVDDCSTDNTGEIVRRWQQDDPRVVYVPKEQNQGASAARNAGLEKAQGSLIAFQDSDDEWLLDKLERQVRELKNSGTEYGATFGSKLIYGHDLNYRYGDGHVAIAPETHRTVVSGDLSKDMLDGNLISPQTLLIRRNEARKIGFFDVRLPCNNDWEYMIRLSEVTSILFSPEPVVVAYIQSDSIHRKLRSKAISFLVILKKHKKSFERYPSIYAARLFSAGRYLHKCGKYKAASICMRRAILAYPKAPKPVVGYLQSMVFFLLHRSRTSAEPVEK